MDKKTIEKIINRFNVEEISKLLDNDSEINIANLKLNDFLVDVRGNNKYADKIELLKTHTKTDKALKYIQELIMINKIFAECNKLQQQINLIAPKQVLPLILHWGSYFIDKYKTSKAEQVLKENNSDVVVAYEKNAEMTIKAIKSLLYNEKIFSNNRFIYKFKSNKIFCGLKKQKLIVNYITNSYFASHWFEKYEYWKKGIYGININNDFELELKIIDKPLLESNTNPYIKERINSVQYEAKAIAEYCFIKYFINPNFKKEYLEFISQRVLDKHFYCECENLVIENVKIKHWIKAYFALYKISQSDVDKKIPQSFISAFILDHIKCKTRKGWIKIFEKNGIPLQSAEIIFDRLVFNKDATDLYDYPFIPVGNRFLVSRTVSKFIHPAMSTISRFNRKDINISIKGRNFENNLYNFFDMIKIPYIKLHNKVNGCEYECDAVFYMDNTFVFCECKSRTGYNIETRNSEKYTDDANQLKRISNFYMQNMDLVFDGFETKGIKIKDKKFYKTKKIVIHSGSVDGVIRKDDVYIMDFNNFIIPFDRGNIFKEYINTTKIKKVFQGNVNIYKLFKFYDYDFCVYDYRNKIIYKNNELKLGDMKIKIEDYHISDFFNKDLVENENRIQMESLLIEAGMPDEIIKEVIDR